MARMTTMSVVCVLLLLVQTVVVQGNCYSGPAIMDETTHVYYCLVSGRTRIEDNTFYLTPDCYNCTCGGGQIHCCGVGIAAGPVNVPIGYKLEMDGQCDYNIVPV
ncbi:uncharacterized protein LOC112575349 [Pomacea canaliculata]|uniref:uncharacterized protein LOC112575349 n=1 Tax=Pomacea canaliculata TaxID=400727 RepID=UPI000D725D3D|nr:uncharacterized protein LOC112575349 [Pomacea canaliculata]